MKCWFISIVLIFTSLNVAAKVQVKYFNQRFVWIEVPSQFVSARLNLPVEGFSVCWVEVKTPKETFDFVFRRGLPYSTCLHYILKIRKILKDNKSVEIIGNAGSKETTGNYSSMFELIRGKTACIGYFEGCENFDKTDIDWPLWKSKPINAKLYP